MHQIYRLKTNVSGHMHLMPAPPANKLELVCQLLAERGVSQLVSLLSDDDVAALGLENEPAVAEAQGLEFIGFPIADFGLPEAETFSWIVARLCGSLKESRSIAIHCRAGIGRTGTMASCILKELGYSGEEAIERVTAARNTQVPDTEEQRQFILNFQLAK